MEFLLLLFFFPCSSHLVWPQGLLIKSEVQLRGRGGDYKRANKLKYCPSGVHVCVCVCARVCKLV